MQENEIFETHSCQNTVAMETSNCLGQDMSYQIVARYILGKVAKFDGVCFNIEKVINVHSQRGHFLTPTPVSFTFHIFRSF